MISASTIFINQNSQMCPAAFWHEACESVFRPRNRRGREMEAGFTRHGE
jgi:hypothetical protein